jgi:hypothetical protein
MVIAVGNRALSPPADRALGYKIDKDGRRHYTIRAIPYQDPEMEAERLKAVHEARVKIVPRV